MPRQGRIGVGWAALREIHAGAHEPTLTVLDVDAALDRLDACDRARLDGSAPALLEELFARATEPEGRLLWGAFGGELRQGALAGVMADAVAKAADVPAGVVRRAAMFARRSGAWRRSRR